MRFEALVFVTALAVSGLGCPDEKSSGGTTPNARFDKVTAKPQVDSLHFCDRTWPATGAAARPFGPPPMRPLGGAPAVEAVERGKGWRWVNVWATWCAPCVEEMALLTRWRAAFEKDGVEVSFEMISIDESAAEPALKTWFSRLPGPLSWVQSPDDVPAWLERSVGIRPDSAIPIHLLVDPSGAQRCVRVGAVHSQDYGAVRAFFVGSASK